MCEKSSFKDDRYEQHQYPPCNLSWESLYRLSIVLYRLVHPQLRQLLGRDSRHHRPFTVLLGLIAVGRTYFSGKQAQEEYAAVEYRKQHGKSELFDDADEAVRLAAKANRQYVKFFVPVFTILLGLAMRPRPEYGSPGAQQSSQ